MEKAMQVFDFFEFYYQTKQDKNMKKFNLLLMSIGVIVSTLCMQSCLSDDDNNNNIAFPTALVTVKPNFDNTSFYMQLNDSTTLNPTNMKVSPFGKKEVRALVNYTIASQEPAHNNHAISINWIDSILTKQPAANLGSMNETTYGNDPVSIVNDWVTIAEDGYLTLRFRTKWSSGIKHIVNLVATGDENNPYKVTFYHNANKDLNGFVGDGLVAFRLSDLPDTEGKYVDLTLEWNSYSGVKTAKFKYCTRKSTNTESGIALGTFTKDIK